mmetsp:Transcript_9734/g.29517  ORF Transcript_9734/g.29517 Transcript_9734/m.29517 type:complete len:93 (-) Transcript_9734:289-567(-)
MFVCLLPFFRISPLASLPEFRCLASSSAWIYLVTLPRFAFLVAIANVDFRRGGARHPGTAPPLLRARQVHADSRSPSLLLHTKLEASYVSVV